VGNLISILRGCPESMLELSVSPRALTADLTQFQRADGPPEDGSDEVDDPLLDLLRHGYKLAQHDFLTELRRQRSSEILAT
jgi:hypothetical protein